ncbi:uncharacterized protein [Haliotis cracherodii]|uniref:uncharacterized protein n=1 Tax=Haliotis cracherodii TaxID=6455 RepID=UPI0039EB7FEA
MILCYSIILNFKNNFQNQDPTSNLKSIANNLKNQHKYKNDCDVIFRALSLIGYICVIVAFTLLFDEERFKYSDPIAAGGAVLSLCANIGIMVNNQKLRYDNRRSIKKVVLPAVLVPVSEGVLKDITCIALQPEDSASSCLHKDVPEDPQKSCPCAWCSGWCKCLCCPCAWCSGWCKRLCCPWCIGWCKYLHSCFPFLLTFEFLVRTYNVVSSGWVLCSNVQTMIDRIHHKHGQMIIQKMSVESRASEGFDVALAIFSFILFVGLIIKTSVKNCKGTEESPVTEIRTLV